MWAETFYEPTDLDVLRMENDLLGHENRHLRAQLAQLQRRTEHLEQQQAQQAQDAVEARQPQVLDLLPDEVRSRGRQWLDDRPAIRAKYRQAKSLVSGRRPG